MTYAGEGKETLALRCGYSDTYRGLFRFVGTLYETSGWPCGLLVRCTSQNAGVGAGRDH